MIDLDTFGARFGALVKTKRGLNGWSQERLAIEIWNDPARKSHVSKLERGGIPNPQANTIDEYANALNISGEEVAACRTPPAPTVAEDGGEGLPLILENLALRFGIENPDATTDEKAAYLRDKARDYQAMQDRLAALGRAEANIANLIGAAQDALKAGEFDEADARLADAEEMQQAEHTLVEVRKQAAIRVQRGDALLLKDDAAGAAAHYEAAAAMFDAFEPGEGAQLRFGKMPDLYNHCLRYGGSGFSLGACLLRGSLEFWTKEDHPENWGKAQNNLGEALRNQAARVEGADGADLLAEAVTAYRAALEVRTRAEHPVDWAAIQNNLAIALRNQAARVEGAAGVDLLAEAVTAYRAALEVRTRAAHPVKWAMTQNNLAIALSHQAARVEGAAGADLLAEAVTAYRAALEVHTRAEHPVHWAMTQNNLANALCNQAKRVEGADGADLLAEAVTAYRAALEVYTRAEHPVDWAMTQNNLAIALNDQAARVEGAAGADLLAEAVTAYRAALEVRTRAAHPVNWAMTQENIAYAFGTWADLAPDEAEGHLRAALAAIDLSLEVYDPEHMSLHFNHATWVREQISAKLTALTP